MALPTKGRVIIDTTVGEIDIELWSKETPKTCRNFLALAMEGYYDGVIFHRVVPGFLVQTGDKTGTGAGGESFYGEPFEDEIHPRLRFPHRGLVAMANNGTKNSNDSQFFITLDRADELHGKHTLFGRCVGDTVYNVVKIGEMELDKNERPVYPPKIKGVRIIDNPFPDIVPRITAAERRAQQRAREEAKREREEEERRRGAKKNVKLLSFGGDEGDGEEDEEPVIFKKKSIVRPDLLEEPESTNVAVLPDFVTNVGKNKGKSKEKEKDKDKEKDNEDMEPDDKKSSKTKKSQSFDADDLARIRAQHALEKTTQLSARQAEIQKMENEIKKLAKKRAGEEDSDDERNKKKQKKVSYLEEETKKYERGRGLKSKGKDGRGKGKRDEGDTLQMMSMFRGKLQASWMDREDGEGEEEKDNAETKTNAEDGKGGLPNVPTLPTEEDPGQEVDDDFGFLNHELHFPKDNGEESRKAERDYEVIDPRIRGQRAREEEKERKKKDMRKLKDGGRGAVGPGGRDRRDDYGRR